VSLARDQFAGMKIDNVRTNRGNLADESGAEEISMEEVLGTGTKKAPAAAKEEPEVPQVETQTL